MFRKQLIPLVVSLFAAQLAQAEDPAKTRLDRSPRHLEWVKVQRGDRTLECFVAFPEVQEKATAVIVIHEIFGLTDWVRSVADQLAEAGYIAIAPDFLSGMGPQGGGTASLGGSDGARAAIGKLSPQQVTDDLKAVQAYVSALPACNGKVTVAGFCWGGGQTFRYATNAPDIKAGFVFYGPAADKADMGRIQCPIYGFYGGNDARITSAVPAAEAAMKAAGKTFEPVVYDQAGHGFMRQADLPDASEANKSARTAAWKRWLELLKKI